MSTETKSKKKSKPNKNTSVKQNNNNVGTTQTGSGLLCFILIMILVLSPVTIYFFTQSIGCNNATCDWAEKKALEDISKVSWGSVTANELKCDAVEKTEDEIYLVRCETTKEDIINYYKSSTIWYGYLESASGSSYYHFESSDKETVINKLRS